jgi:ankyrin repeat protein
LKSDIVGKANSGTEKSDPADQIQKIVWGHSQHGETNWEAVFGALVTHGLNPDEVINPRNGDSLLMFAAGRGEADICERLLELGASPQGRSRGRPVLVEMVRCRGAHWGAGHRKVVKLLASTINVADAEGMTALMFASMGNFGSTRGSVALVQLLMLLGANIAAKDRLGQTALMHAVRSNSRSSTDANLGLIELLEQRTIDDEALRLFRNLYEARFSAAGELELVPRASGKAPAPVAATHELQVPEEPVASAGKTRLRAARADASVHTICQKIEDMFGLPESSVSLVDSKGRALRGADTIAKLHWKHR